MSGDESISRSAAVCWACAKQLPPVQKLALIYIANGSRASADRLADFCGIGVMEAHQIIGQLEAVGLVGEDGDVTYTDPPRAPWPPQKRVIPKQVREAVFSRDHYTCRHCGALDELTIDHIYPESLGGGDDPDNLQVLCRPCNSRKGTRV